MAGNEGYEIPESGAVFTFGRSGFADNQQSHFFIRNDSVIEISCGDEHTAIVCEKGRVFLFGNNDYGQLGLGHTKTITKPSCLKYLKPFHSTHVACGKSHTIVSTECGRLFTFGSNTEGQLGTGDLADKLTPHLVNTKNFTGRISALSAGCFHSACLTEIGELYLWGSNADGQCGIEVDRNILIPTKIEFENPISTVSCGYYHSAFISEGVLYCFGEEENGKLGYKKINSRNLPEKIQTDFKCMKVSCGGNHTIILSDERKVYSCGSNFSGQLGIGSIASENYSLSLVKFPEDSIKIIEISAGESHSAFLTDMGELFTCGDGRYGKTCSESESSNFISPIAIMQFSQFYCSSVSCGGCQTMVLARHLDSNINAENCKITSLPPLKIKKPPNERENVQNEKQINPNIENEDDSSENPEPTIDDIKLETDNFNNVIEREINAHLDVDANGPKIFERPIEELHNTHEENLIDQVKTENMNQPDVIISKESGIKRILNAFRSSAISKECSKREDRKIKDDVGITGSEKNENRQTSRTCCII